MDDFDGYEGDESLLAPSSAGGESGPLKRSGAQVNPVQSCCLSFREMLKGLFKKGKKGRTAYTEMT